MTDIAYRYNHSKHSRRIKSRQKKSQKLCTKYENVHKSHKIKFRERVYVKGTKSMKEIQRKQWVKYNKKSKPRNSKKISLEFDGYETDYYSDQDDEDETQKDPSDTRTIQTLPGLCIKKKFGEIDYYSVSILKTKMNDILSKSFHSYEYKYSIHFDMDTFYGQCCFWYYIMEKLGIVTELFHTKYLMKCDKDWLGKVSYYTGFIDAITSEMLSTQHILYILDEIDVMADAAFENDYCYDAKHVVMSKDILINILDSYNSENIGIDLCSLIGDYTMDRKDGVLFHYDSQKQITSSEYNIGTHKVIDKCIENAEEYETEVIYKVFDGKDITQYYNKCEQIWSNSCPLFHYGTYRYAFGTVLKIAWHKFKEYYRHQMENNFEIKYNMLYMTLLYYVDQARVCRNIDCDTTENEVHIWQCCYRATLNQPLLHNLLRMINRTVGISEEFGRSNSTYGLHNIFENYFSDKLSSNADMQEFCSLMERNCYFAHKFSVNNFFKDSDHHKQQKTFWINLWQKISVNTDSIILKQVYQLMVVHCSAYKKYCKTYTEYGAVYRGRRRVWGKQKMHKFNAMSFFVNDILPIILRILNINKDMGLIINRFKRRCNYSNVKGLVMSYEMCLQLITDILRILDSEECTNSAQNVIDIHESYVNGKFSRNYMSKKINSKKKYLRSKFRKCGVKSRDKRIENKMKKYKTNFLLL